MKKNLFTLVLLLLTVPLFAQYKMTIKKVDNSTQDIWVQDIIEITFSNDPFTCGTSTITYAGQTYNTVQISSQCWLKENLNIGSMIQGTVNPSSNDTIEKYCFYNNSEYCTTYGGLYQWAEAVQYLNGAANTTSPSPVFSGNVQGICPTGWHIPTQAEFAALKAAIVVNSDGNTLKAVGQGTGSGSGTNTSGFTALLAGYRNYDGTLQGLSYSTNYWSSTESNASLAYNLCLFNNDNIIRLTSGLDKDYGFSVRCLKD